jgi:PAS domain S-box-containing protein
MQPWRRRSHLDALFVGGTALLHSLTPLPRPPTIFAMGTPPDDRAFNPASNDVSSGPAAAREPTEASVATSGRKRGILRLMSGRSLVTQLRRSEARWRSLANSVPDSVVLLDAEGKFVSATPQLEMFPPEQWSGLTGVDFVVPEHRQRVRQALDEVQRTGKPVEVEVQEAAQRRWFASRIAPWWEEGRVVGTITVSRDISAMKERENALQERTARLQFLLDQVPAVVWTVDKSLNCISAGGAGLAAIGLTPETAVGINIYRFFDVKKNEEATTGHGRALTGESVALEYEFAGRTYHALLQPLRDATGAITGATGVAVDITDRSLSEKKVRSDRDELERAVRERTEALEREQQVLQQLVDLHDRDRRLVAYEIHDGMIQDMTAALMFFDSASDPIRRLGGKNAESMQHASHLLRTAIQEGRRLIDGLRPPVLEEYGLLDAISNHVEEMQSHHGIEVDFQHEVQFSRLAPVVERAIYRIVQESLNNIALHSGADRAKVTMRQRERFIDLCIEDSGHGFDVSSVHQKRYGLASIRERARLLGGQARIDSTPGQGTAVRVTLPLTDVLLARPPEGSADD